MNNKILKTKAFKEKIISCERNRRNRYRLAWVYQNKMEDLMYANRQLEEELLNIDTDIYQVVQTRRRGHSLYFEPEDSDEEEEEGDTVSSSNEYTGPLNQVCPHIRTMLLATYDENTECPVCLQPMRKENVIISICGHFVCYGCSEKLHTCPVCRT